MKNVYLVCIFLFPCFSISANPYQLIESESATVINRNNMELKLDGVYESGYVPVGLGRVGLRYGLYRNLEGFFQLEGGQFLDQDETRITSATGTVKYHFWKRQFYSLNLFGYGKYRHSFGDTIVVPYEGDDEDMEDVAQVVSPYADEGRDISAGLLGRNSVKLFRKKSIYMIGIEYTRAMNREYGDFEDDQQNIASLMFVPEYHTKSGKVMWAFENKVSYWINRGYMYSAMPQIRWEFISYWVLETGVVVPVVGAGNNYRTIVGITYENL